MVLKEDKSKDFKEEYPEKILFILITLSVLKEGKSIDIKEKHPENIQNVLVNKLLNIIFILVIPFLHLYIYIQIVFFSH